MTDVRDAALETSLTDPLSAAERMLDEQPLPNEDRLEIEELAHFFAELELDVGDGSAGHSEWLEYYESVLTGLPILFDEEVENIEQRQYGAAPIELKSPKDAAEPKLHLKLHIDEKFGAQTQRLNDVAQYMIDQVAKGQAQCFYARAKQKGLTYRRSRTLPFPHPLPYKSAAPTTPDGRYQEEAAVVEAAIRFAFSRKPPVNLFIDHFAANNRVLGSAVVNLYNRKKELRIKLNGTQLAGGRYSNATWASVVAHEILHNLGWGHPKGNYPPSLAIEIYQHCIKGSGDGFVEDGDGLNFIR